MIISTPGNEWEEECPGLKLNQLWVDIFSGLLHIVWSRSLNQVRTWEVKMVVPARAVFRPSGFFLNLAVRNANGLGNLTRLAVAFSLRGHFEGRYKAKGSRQRNLWQECGFLDKDTLNYIDVTTWWSSLYGQRGDGEQQDWRRWKKSPVKIQHWLPIHLMLWSLKHLRFPQLPSSEGGKGGRFLFLLISVVKLMCYCAPFQSKDKFLQK